MSSGNLQPVTQRLIREIGQMIGSSKERNEEILRDHLSSKNRGTKYDKNAIQVLRRYTREYVIENKTGKKRKCGSDITMTTKKIQIKQFHLHIDKNIASAISSKLSNSGQNFRIDSVFPETKSLPLREKSEVMKFSRNIDNMLSKKGGVYEQLHGLVANLLTSENSHLTKEQFIQRTNPCKPRSVYINYFKRGTKPVMDWHVDEIVWPTCVLNMSIQSTPAFMAFKHRTGGDHKETGMIFEMTSLGDGLVFGKTVHKIANPSEDVLLSDRITMIVFY